MTKSRVKITNNFDVDKLPMTMPCPNDDCESNISFMVSDIEAKKTVKCESCGALVNLKPTE